MFGISAPNLNLSLRSLGAPLPPLLILADFLSSFHNHLHSSGTLIITMYLEGR